LPKPRSPERGVAHEIFLQHNGNIENRRIAEQLSNRFGGEVEKLEKKVAVWKQRDDWLKKKNVVQHSNANDVQRKGKVVQRTRPTKTLPINNSKNDLENDPLHAPLASDEAQLPKTNTTSRGGAPKGNGNAIGNRGGNGGPKGNRNAVVTGEHASIPLSEILLKKFITNDADRTLAHAIVDEADVLCTLILGRVHRLGEMRLLRDEAVNSPSGFIVEKVVKTTGVTTGTQVINESAKFYVNRIDAAIGREMNEIRKDLVSLKAIRDGVAGNTPLGDRIDAIMTQINVAINPVPNRELPSDIIEGGDVE